MTNQNEEGIVKCDDGSYLCNLKIVNNKGLHARASAKFVNLVKEYDATINVSKDGQTVGGSSIMGLMTLSASIGTAIEVKASGEQAHLAIVTIKELVTNGFGELE